MQRALKQSILICMSFYFFKATDLPNIPWFIADFECPMGPGLRVPHWARISSTPSGQDLDPHEFHSWVNQFDS